jgi:hypothetical protein
MALHQCRTVRAGICDYEFIGEWLPSRAGRRRIAVGPPRARKVVYHRAGAPFQGNLAA